MIHKRESFKLTQQIGVDTAALSKRLQDKVVVKGIVWHFKEYASLLSCQELDEVMIYRRPQRWPPVNPLFFSPQHRLFRPKHVRLSYILSFFQKLKMHCLASMISTSFWKHFIILFKIKYVCLQWGTTHVPPPSFLPMNRTKTYC